MTVPIFDFSFSKLSPLQIYIYLHSLRSCIVSMTFILPALKKTSRRYSTKRNQCKMLPFIVYWKRFLTFSYDIFILLIIVTCFGTTRTSFWWTTLFLIACLGAYWRESKFESYSHASKFFGDFLRAAIDDGHGAQKQPDNQLSKDIKAKGAVGKAIFHVDDNGRTSISITDIEVVKTPADLQNERTEQAWAQIHARIAELELDPLYPRAEIDTVRGEFEAGGYGSRDRLDSIIQLYSASQLHDFAYGADDSSLPPVLQLVYQAETNILPSLSKDERRECFIVNRIRRLGAQKIEAARRGG